MESMYSLCIVFSGSPSGVPVYIDSTGSPLAVHWESMQTCHLHDPDVHSHSTPTPLQVDSQWTPCNLCIVYIDMWGSVKPSVCYKSNTLTVVTRCHKMDGEWNLEHATAQCECVINPIVMNTCCTGFLADSNCKVICMP